MTTILVTHEQEEAFDLGDRVAVLNEGVVEQVGTPLDLYRDPRSGFVADFVGRSSRIPCFVACRGEESGGLGEAPGLGVTSSYFDGELLLPSSTLLSAERAARSVGDGSRPWSGDLWLRPEHLALRLLGTPDHRPSGSFLGIVERSRWIGPRALIRVRVEALSGTGEREMQPLVLDVLHDQLLAPGLEVGVAVEDEAGTRLLDANGPVAVED